MLNVLKCNIILFILVKLIIIKAEEISRVDASEEPIKQTHENVIHEPNAPETSTQINNEIDNLPNYINLTDVTTENVTVVNTTGDIANTTEKHVSCLLTYDEAEVNIVNDTELIKLLVSNPNITNKETPANCIVILFYSKYCPFSSMAAPHFNALPRAFPNIKMVAINAMWYHIFNAQNGVVGVPSVLLFHNGKPVAKFNDSEYTLELFSKFITKYTGIQPEEKSFVTSADFSAPVSSVPSKENDVLLILSWAFILVCALYYFGKSRYWTWIVETVQNTWRESEAQAQHEHND